MVKEKEDVYFVRLEEPSELRRTILESTRDIVDALKKFEEFKSVRDEKIKEIEKLRSDMRGISRLIAKGDSYELIPYKDEVLEYQLDISSVVGEEMMKLLMELSKKLKKN